jgi:hypothetical protein
MITAMAHFLIMSSISPPHPTFPFVNDPPLLISLPFPVARGAKLVDKEPRATALRGGSISHKGFLRFTRANPNSTIPRYGDISESNGALSVEFALPDVHLPSPGPVSLTKARRISNDVVPNLRTQT